MVFTCQVGPSSLPLYLISPHWQLCMFKELTHVSEFLNQFQSI